MEQSSEPRAWRLIFIRAVGIGVGFSLVVAGLLGAVLWYHNRPAPVRPWNRDAITAKYADLYGRTGNPAVMTFRYTIENHSGRDYDLPATDSLYKVLANGKGLERDATLKWDGGPVVPAGQKVNIGIQIEYEYPGGSTDLDEKFAAFTKRRLSEIEGFAMLDKVNRYEVRFPKPPDVK